MSVSIRPAGADDDPFAHDDAAYVLGALEPAERAAFEHHLRSCAACSARVREVADVPRLLAGVSAADLPVVGPDELAVPSTLLTGLRAAAARRRRRVVVAVAALGAVAAACAIALVVVLLPSSSAGGPPAQAFTAVQIGSRHPQSTPVMATARLTAERWGTSIQLHCAYEGAVSRRDIEYGLVIVDRRGRAQNYGDWGVSVGRPFDGTTVTALQPDQIEKLQITVNGIPILQLRPS